MKSLRRLVVSALLAAPVLSAAAQPAVTPDLPVMRFDDLGVYAVGYAYRGQPEQQFPLGWSGFFEDRTGVACEPFGTQNGKRAFLLHCPWRNGTGITFQQFVLRLPAGATRILLRGATAMRSQNVTNSDGVTFRLYADGAKLFDYHQTNDVWRQFEFDFSARRGSNLTVRFEVDPGPKNNPSFDYSLWGDRELVLEGYTPPVTNPPGAPAPCALEPVVRANDGSSAIQSGFPGTSTSSLSNGVACFRYTGPDGVLEYQWRAPQSANDGLFGTTHAQRADGGRHAGHGAIGKLGGAFVEPAGFAGRQWMGPDQSGLHALANLQRLGSTTATVRITGQMVGK